MSRSRYPPKAYNSANKWLITALHKRQLQLPAASSTVKRRTDPIYNAYKRAIYSIGHCADAIDDEEVAARQKHIGPVLKDVIKLLLIEHGKHRRPVSQLSSTASKKRKYKPKHRTGGFGILIALFFNRMLSGAESTLPREELQRRAQPFCEASYTVRKAGTHYTAWGSRKTLEEEHSYIVGKRWGSRKHYRLTEEGFTVAKELVNALPLTQWPDEARALHMVRNGGVLNTTDSSSITVASGKSSGSGNCYGSNSGSKRHSTSSAQLAVSGAATGHRLGSSCRSRKRSTPDLELIQQLSAASGGDMELMHDLFMASASDWDDAVDFRNSNIANSQSSVSSAKLPPSKRRKKSDSSSVKKTPTKSSMPSLAMAETYTATGHSLDGSFGSDYKRDGIGTVNWEQMATIDTQLICVRDCRRPVRVRGEDYALTLLVDSSEVPRAKDREDLKAHCRSEKVRVEIAKLKMADFIWTLTPSKLMEVSSLMALKTGAMDNKKKTRVCDTIVERKRFDDLLASIKTDGRYLEQKSRMLAWKLRKRTRNVVYLCEGVNKENLEYSDLKICRQAMAETSEANGFTVLRTESVTDSWRKLTAMTRQMHWHLGSSMATAIDSMDTLEGFQKNTKQKALAASVLWTLQLTAIDGVTQSSAQRIASKYPTVAHLMKAYAAVRSEEQKVELLQNTVEAISLGVSLSVFMNLFV